MASSIAKEFIQTMLTSDLTFYSELVEEINEILNEELEKNYEDINSELIDDCCNALEIIYSIKEKETVDYNQTEKICAIINKYSKKGRARKFLYGSFAAAFTICLMTGINFFVKSTETKTEYVGGSYNIKEQYKEEEIHKQDETQVITTTQIPEKITRIATTKSTVIEKKVKRITVSLPKSFKNMYTHKSEIKLDGIVVNAEYDDGTTRVIDINKCGVDIGTTGKDGETKITIKYKNVSTAIYVTIKDQKTQDPVILTSIYGTFDGSYNTSTMKVFGVYSDGTENEIPLSDCVVDESFSQDFGEYIVTVEYGGCNFKFIAEKGAES